MKMCKKWKKIVHFEKTVLLPDGSDTKLNRIFCSEYIIVISYLYTEPLFISNMKIDHTMATKC